MTPGTRHGKRIQDLWRPEAEKPQRRVVILELDELHDRAVEALSKDLGVRYDEALSFAVRYSFRAVYALWQREREEARR